MIWLTILPSFPRLQSLRSAESKSLTELESFGDYLSFLFPNSTVPQPTLVISIGGKITGEKFRFLEQAIDMVSLLSSHPLFVLSLTLTR